MGIIRPARFSDLPYMAMRMRREDVAEVYAASGHSPAEALLLGLQTSSECLVAEYEGRPTAIFGVGPAEGAPEIGIVWLLATDEMPRLAVQALRVTPPILERWHEDYPILCNVVDARNALHIRWLKRAGFHLLRRLSCGFEGREFIEFTKLKVPQCANP